MNKRFILGAEQHRDLAALWKWGCYKVLDHRARERRQDMEDLER